MRKRRQKCSGVSNFAIWLVVFKCHHGSEGVNGLRLTSTSTFTQLLSSDTDIFFFFSVAFRPRRPYGLLRDGELRTATSAFTQLISSSSSSSVLLYGHTDRAEDYGTTFDAHLDFHAASGLWHKYILLQCCFTSTYRDPTTFTQLLSSDIAGTARSHEIIYWGREKL